MFIIITLGGWTDWLCAYYSLLLTIPSSTLFLDTSAWTAGQNDLSQFIEIDLGRQFNISAIGTQGRQHTLEFVQEFKLESGIDGHDYNIYRDRNGNIKVHTTV